MGRVMYAGANSADGPPKFQFVGGDVCLDFTNTVGGKRGLSTREYLNSYADFVSWCRQAGTCLRTRLGRAQGARAGLAGQWGGDRPCQPPALTPGVRTGDPAGAAIRSTATAARCAGLCPASGVPQLPQKPAPRSSWRLQLGHSTATARAGAAGTPGCRR